MKFHFESNLQFQLDAINLVIRLFEGAPFIRSEDRVFAEVFANKLIIDPREIYKNRDAIIKQNRIVNPSISDEQDFSIEMETGTGKTYVYLRTILELNRAYGLTKFIIIVPSIAVKEGVLKTLDITKSHFAQLYDSLPYDYFEYDSKKLNKIKHFAYSNTLQIMVMNMQAFNTDDRIINQERDVNNGVRLIDLIKQTSPILILDEPQEGMDSENMIERINTLNPLFKLRYSATHKVIKNLLYQLTPFDAYNQRLVKKIEVFSIHETNTQSNITIIFEDIKLSAGNPEAKLQLSTRLKGGDFKIKSMYVKKGDDLEKKTGNPIYHGWIVERINQEPFTNEAKIRFSNGRELAKNSKLGWDKKNIFKEQLRWSIKNHFKKKEKNNQRNIKTLTLFFIDRVANYVEPDGIIRKLFEEVYKEEFVNTYGEEPENIAVVHGGYFAKTSNGEYTDNENAMEKNKEIYDLILKDKEKILSLSEPLEFIFSHSALGVGWDNPNVFTICTLNESQSYIKKRQEIGRGLRICVSQSGERIYDSLSEAEDKEVNVLTIVANQSYYAFAASYQQELIDALGSSAQIAPVTNARKAPIEVKLNKQTFESEDFRKLWDILAQRTHVRVYFQESAIIEKCVDALSQISVPANIIAIELTRITGMQYKTGSTQIFKTEGRGTTEKEIAPHFVSLDLAGDLARNTALSIQTASEILNQVSNKDQIIKNPMMYLSEATKRIKSILFTEMVRGVRYEITSERYDYSLFEEIIETTKNTLPVENSIYDQIIYDSYIERDFALDVSHEHKVRLFLKLPAFYVIPTPLGKYHPDWGLIIEKKELEKTKHLSYYFVVETKGSMDTEDLREKELIKIKCAIKHFEAIGFKEFISTPVDNFTHFKKEVNKTNQNLL